MSKKICHLQTPFIFKSEIKHCTLLLNTTIFIIFWRKLTNCESQLIFKQVQTNFLP